MWAQPRHKVCFATLLSFSSNVSRRYLRGGVAAAVSTPLLYLFLNYETYYVAIFTVTTACPGSVVNSYWPMTALTSEIQI
jgi:hypothetical protein